MLKNVIKFFEGVKIVASLAQIVAVFKDFFGGVFFGVIWQNRGGFQIQTFGSTGSLKIENN